MELAPRLQLFCELRDFQIPAVRARKAIDADCADVEEAIAWRPGRSWGANPVQNPQLVALVVMDGLVALVALVRP